MNTHSASELAADAQRIATLRMLEAQLDVITTLLDNSPMIGDGTISTGLRAIKVKTQHAQNEIAKSYDARGTAHHAIGELAQKRDDETDALRRFKASIVEGQS